MPPSLMEHWCSPVKAVRRMKSDNVCEFTLQVPPDIPGTVTLVMGRQDATPPFCMHYPEYRHPRKMRRVLFLSQHPKGLNFCTFRPLFYLGNPGDGPNLRLNLVHIQHQGLHGQRAFLGMHRDPCPGDLTLWCPHSQLKVRPVLPLLPHHPHAPEL